MPAIGRKKYLLSISIAVIALNIFRCPELLIHPRFFAEEGAAYFSSAFQQSFLDNIFTSHFGYYTLYNQLATSLANLFPLDHAPLITTLMSLFIQVGISLYVLWGDIPLLDTLSRRTALALAIPLISWPGHWLTIIGTQCWFGAGAFLLLLSASNNKGIRVYAFRSGYLLLAGLTGVVSGFMAPAFLWRSMREKSKEFLAYAAILFLCMLVHAGVLLEAFISRSPEISGRFIQTPLTTMLGKTVVYQFAIPFTGRGFFEKRFIVDIGTNIKKMIEDILDVHLLIHDLFIIPVMTGIAVIIITLTIFWNNRTRVEVQTLAIALASVTILSNICSTSLAGGPRYYFIPSIMILTTYLGAKEMQRSRVVVTATTLLVLATIAGNGYEYRTVMHKQAYDPSYPHWRTELALWRANPSHQISIWPNPWKMSLDNNQKLTRNFQTSD